MWRVISSSPPVFRAQAGPGSFARRLSSKEGLDREGAAPAAIRRKEAYVGALRRRGSAALDRNRELHPQLPCLVTIVRAASLEIDGADEPQGPQGRVVE